MKAYSFGAGGSGGIGGANRQNISRSGRASARISPKAIKAGRGTIRVGGRSIGVRISGGVAREAATKHVIGRVVGGKNARVVFGRSYSRGAKTEARGTAARSAIQARRVTARAAATRSANRTLAAAASRPGRRRAKG